jgi:uncharacterized protein YndB with AHSA1/START domain
MQTEMITVACTVNAPVEKVWQYWNAPEHIVKWCSATPEWHTPTSENDLKAGGSFKSRMEARDGSMGFDFGGVYSAVQENEHIAYTMDDGRQVIIDFTTSNDVTTITERFDPEQQNPAEMQRAGWQAIMDSFKRYTEEN